MSLRGVTCPTIRELVQFLADNSIPWGAVRWVTLNMSNHIDIMYDTDGMDAVLQEVVVPVVGAEDGDEIPIMGLTPDGFYELVCFVASPGSTTGLTTHRQWTLYQGTGALPEHWRWQAPAAVPLANGNAYPYAPGYKFKADALGQVYIVYAVTPGAVGDDVDETLTLYLRPIS